MADIVGDRTLGSQWDETVRFFPDSTFLEYISTTEDVTAFTYREFDRQLKPGSKGNLFPSGR